jgi:hypothetical protein
MARKLPRGSATLPQAPKVTRAQTITPASRVTTPARPAGRPKTPGSAAVRAAKKGQ